MARKSKPGRPRGMSPFKAGLIALVLVAVGSYFGYTKANPFASPYEFTAFFESANNLQPRSPVRIAGVDVGKVTSVKPVADGNGAAEVKMEMTEAGLPLHTDAQLKIRPRIFLEGNFFVQVHPGSPSAPELKEGGSIPATQTATPVQFGQVLTALQSDTREDLQTFLREYSRKGIEGRAAKAYNESIRYWEDAYKYSALVNEAMLGTEPHDLSRLLRGQQRTFAALARNPENLKDLVTNFNTTAAALAREDDALEATIPALRDLLRDGRPALQSLNGALPSLRAFARDALPGVRSTGPAVDASMPFIRQARRLVGEDELKGLVRDLRPTVPALARLNRATIPLLDENRALSSCQNRVLLPFSKTPIPDPDFPAASGSPFSREGGRSFVGLAGESRIHDANSPMFRVPLSTGSVTVQNTSSTGQSFFSRVASAPVGVRPDRPDKPPRHRPDVPCETQQPPDLNAPMGPADKVIVPNTGLPLPRDLEKRQEEGVREVAERIARHPEGIAEFDFSFGQPGRRRGAERSGEEAGGRR